MSKKVVFISHITEEKELALAFKKLIEASFLGMMEVFVSSDENDIPMGQKWLDNITEALKNCVIEVILCSPQSVKRPWINFEAGAGWIRGISVIPLCHSGMSPSELPMPLNLLQAAQANQVSSLKLIFPVLANAIGAQTPKNDFTEFILQVQNFERQYTFWDECNNAFAFILEMLPESISALESQGFYKFGLREADMNTAQFKQKIRFLITNNIMEFSDGDYFAMGAKGILRGCILRALEKFIHISNDEKCILKSTNPQIGI